VEAFVLRLLLLLVLRKQLLCAFLSLICFVWYDALQYISSNLRGLCVAYAGDTSVSISPEDGP
jgi:hypothetical protein